MRKIKTDEQAKKLREQLDETATFHGVQIVLMVVLSLLIAILTMNFWARFNVRMWLLLSDALKNCADDYYRCEMQQSYFDESKSTKIYYEIIYIFLTIFLYLLKCPQSLILSALRAFCFCGKPHISRSIFLYFRYQAWLKSW